MSDTDPRVVLGSADIAALIGRSERTARRRLQGLQQSFGEGVVAGGHRRPYATSIAALEEVETPSLRKGDKDVFERMYRLENEVARLKEELAELRSIVTAANGGQPRPISTEVATADVGARVSAE